MTVSRFSIRHRRWTAGKLEPNQLKLPAIDGGSALGPSSFWEKMTELEDEVVRFHLGPSVPKRPVLQATNSIPSKRLRRPATAA